MPQITWRNIDAPDLTGTANILQQVQDTFKGVGNNLKQSIQDYRTQQETNVDLLRENNKQAILDYYAGFDTPEKLNAAIQSGEAAKFVSGFNGVVDPAAIRGAGNAQLDLLRKQAMEARKYDDANLERAALPVYNQAMLDATNGKWGAVVQGLGTVDTPGESKVLKDAYDIYGNYLQGKRADQSQSNDNARLGMSREQHNAAMADRQRELDRENQLLKAGREVAQTGDVYTSGLKNTQAKLDQLYAYAGVSPNQIDASGNLITDTLTPDQKKILADGVKGIEAESQAGLLQRVKGRLLSSDYNLLTQEQRDGLLTSADNSLYGLKALSKEERETQANAQALIERSRKSNPFSASADTDPIASMNAVLDKHKIKTDDGKLLFGETDDDERRGYTSEALSLSTDGVVIDTPNGPERIKLPPAIIDIFLGTVEGGYFEINGSLTDGVTDWLVQGAPTVKELKAEGKGKLQSIAARGLPSDQGGGANAGMGQETTYKRDLTQSQVYKWFKEDAESRKQLDNLSSEFTGRYNPQVDRKVRAKIDTLKKLNKEVNK